MEDESIVFFGILLIWIATVMAFTIDGGGFPVVLNILLSVAIGFYTARVMRIEQEVRDL